MDIYSLIQTHVVDQMTPVITLTSIETIAGTPVKYKLFSCNTQWVTINDKITIDGVVYRVVSFVQDEYLIVTGASAPVQLYFQLPAPTFEHGTHRRVSTERVKKSASKRTITPMIYALPIKGKTRPSIDSMFGFSGKVRFFCLTTFDKNGDSTIATQQKNIVNPMSALVRYFIQKFEERLDLFEEIQEVFQDDFMDFGDPTIWGAKERIFEEFLSGVGVNFDLNIYSQDECCTDTPAVSCLPVKFKIEGVLAETLPSGDTFNLNLIDTDGNVPIHTYNAATDTLEVPAPGGGGSIDIDINGTSFVTGQSTDIDIPVVNEGDAPVGSVDGSFFRIGTGAVNVNGSFVDAALPEQDVNLFVKDSAGNQKGTDIGANTIEISNSQITVNSVNAKSVLAEASANILVVASDGSTTVGNWNIFAQKQVISDATVSNSDDTYIASVLAEGSLELPDITVTDSDGSTSSYPSAKNFVCTLGLQKLFGLTGQDVPYATYDDAWRLANGEFDNPILTDYYTLATVNEWGHNKRYTGDTGGYMDEATGNFFNVDGSAAATFLIAFPNGWIRDYGTRLRWYYQRTGTRTWADAVSMAQSDTVGGESGARLPTEVEYNSLSSGSTLSPTYIDSRLFNWSVFNMWSSTTDKTNTLNAYRFSTGSNTWAVAAKTTLNGGAYVKSF